MNPKEPKDNELQGQEAETSSGRSRKRIRAWEQRRFRTNLLFAALVIILYVFITNLGQLGGRIVDFFSLFSPLVIGILIALVLNVPLTKIESLIGKLTRRPKAKHKLPEKAVTLISLVLTFLLALLLLYVVGNTIVPEIADSVKNIVGSVENYYPKALAKLDEWGVDTEELEKLFAKIDWNEVWKTLGQNAGTILDTAVSTVSGLFGALVNILSAVIFAAYLLANRKSLKRQMGMVLDAYCKPRMAQNVKYVGKLVIRTFSNFFSGQCLEAVILGTIFFIAMSIARFPYALVISVIIAVTALVPYVGTFFACAVGAVLILMQSPLQALAFVVMFLVIQQLENNLIYPRVVGTSVGLPAIWTFVALIVGGSIYGIAGMILFIPATSVAYTLLKRNVQDRLAAKKRMEEAEASSEETAEE